MKSLAVLLVVVAAASARPEEEFYSSRFDNFDAHELVENVRLLKNYGKCFLDEGPCTNEGSEFKKIIPDALQTNCAKCTPKQKELIRTVVKGFQTKLPGQWKELVQKHDLDGQYKEVFEKFINESS